MTIKTLVILAVLFGDVQEEIGFRSSRAENRAQRDRIIDKNRRTYNSIIGGEIWFDSPYHDEIHDKVKHPEWEGKYVRYSGGQIYDKEQKGRWATEKLSGHRRLQKWSRDYYQSWADEKHRCWDKADRRFEERYGE